jgi:hypothetical protein
MICNDVLKRCLLLLLLGVSLFTPEFSPAQNLLNTNPPSFKWRKIRTENFNILFNEKNREEAVDVANTLERFHGPVGDGLGIRPKKISVVLQNQTVVSNGFVTSVPFHSEFGLFPPQDYNFQGLLKWTDMLSVHEYRHVAQYTKSLTGLNKIVFYLFGFSTAGSLAHLAVPDWFWEGDAVLTETSLTQGGRGRIPEFGLLMRTNMLLRGPFNYYLQYLRSFRLNVPDHYVTGYYFSAWLRRTYGQEKMNKILDRTWSFPVIPFRFSGQLRRMTGTGLLGNYDRMASDLDSLWKEQLKHTRITSAAILNKRVSVIYTDYEYPSYLSDGKIIALKSGMDDISTFIILNSSGKEEKIFIPGIIKVNGFPTSGGRKIAWNELAFDPRWPARDYSDIKIFDIDTKKVHRITRKGRYSSAGLSPDGAKVVALETSEAMKHNLVILNSTDGKILERIENPENDYFLTPRFSSDGKSIIAIKQTSKGKSLWTYDLATKLRSIILGPVPENIGNPYLFNEYAFFNSPYSGIDNIYVFNSKNKKIYQVTSRKYGAFNPVVSDDGESILFSDFSRDGMNVAQMGFTPSDWVDRSSVTPFRENYFLPLPGNDMTSDAGTKDKQATITDVPVRKFAGIFNPYSWGPYISGTDLNLLLGVQMKDVLSTTSIDAGYEYNANESTGRWITNISYQGIYPVLNFSASTGTRAVVQDFNVGTPDAPKDSTVHLTWHESIIDGSVLLPFNLTHSRYFEYLNISETAGINNVTHYNYDRRYPDQLSDGILLSNSLKIEYQRNLKKSKRDIYSRLAQDYFLQLNNTPFGGDFTAAMFSAQTRFFFPGLAKHHSLILRLAYQAQDLSLHHDSYWFSSPIVYPRGYGYIPYEQFVTGSANYTLPLFYPDMHIGPILNIQRVYSNLFVDYGKGQSVNTHPPLTELASAGFELSFDFNLMRFLPLLNAGLRYSYRPDIKTGEFQVLIGRIGI